MAVFCGYCGAAMGHPHWEECPLHDKEDKVCSLAGDVLARPLELNTARCIPERFEHDNDDGVIYPEDDIQ